MINQVDITKIEFDSNLFLTKIISNTLCYGDFDFCNTFSQQIDGQATAYINILSGAATVFATDDCDFDELKEFLCFFNVGSIFCNESAAKKLGFNSVSQGFILKYNLGLAEKTYPLKYDCDFKKIYYLMKQSFSLPEYDEFVSDLSFRLNHGFSRLVFCENGVAFTGWETSENAVISAITVDITKRGQKIGKKLLNSLLHSLIDDKKQVFVYCEEENLKFYQNNGFIVVDKYFVGKDF